MWLTDGLGRPADFRPGQPKVALSFCVIDFARRVLPGWTFGSVAVFTLEGAHELEC